MEYHDLPVARYRVEIENTTLTVECKGLVQVLALLDRQAGAVHVLDRQEPSHIFDGTADEFRDSLWLRGGRTEEAVSETLARSL